MLEACPSTSTKLQATLHSARPTPTRLLVRAYEKRQSALAGPLFGGKLSYLVVGATSGSHAVFVKNVE